MSSTLAVVLIFSVGTVPLSVTFPFGMNATLVTLAHKVSFTRTDAYGATSPLILSPITVWPPITLPASINAPLIIALKLGLEAGSGPGASSAVLLEFHPLWTGAGPDIKLSGKEANVRTFWGRPARGTVMVSREVLIDRQFPVHNRERCIEVPSDVTLDRAVGILVLHVPNENRRFLPTHQAPENRQGIHFLRVTISPENLVPKTGQAVGSTGAFRGALVR